MENKIIKGSKGGCFAIGTMILTPNGDIPIEKLQVGDKIYGFDSDEKKLFVGVITETHKHKTTNLRGDRLLLVRYNGNETVLTENHWMYVGDGVFKEMKDIKIGDYVRDENNDPKVVYDKLILPDHEYVYNLTTTLETFIADGLRVHNKGGGKSSSTTTHVPTEDPNSLQSNSVARIVDLIGEGEIEGLVDGVDSIYLNETVLNGNYSGVTTYERTGTSTQTYIPGISNVAANTTIVNLKVEKGSPIVRTVSDTDVDDIRVVLAVPALYLVEDDGDIVKLSVTMKIQIQPDGGSYQDAKTVVFSGKCTSTYQRAVRIKDLEDTYGAGPWNIQVIRWTANPTSTKQICDTYWYSYSEIKERKIQYRDSAIVGLEVDAQQFGTSVPNRAYDVKGLKILVPNNRTWNQTTDVVTYSGTWDGNFGAAEFCDNPAWVLYDILTNERYGLGLDESYIDKWALYNIGVYNDTQVDDGFDDTERRFTFNYVIQNRAEAYHVINMVASNMRATPYWTAGLASFTQDSPKDASRLVSAANVENGLFNYSSTTLKERYTVVYVTWNDPNDFYRQAVEVVEDVDGIALYGHKPTDVVAYGCTSRGQAYRYGKWILESQLEETERIEYTAGFDHIDCAPGEIVDVADPHKSALNRFGGRIVSSSGTGMVIDNAVDLVNGETYTVEFTTNSGVVSRDLTNSVPSSDVTNLTWTTPLTTQPEDNGMWLLIASDLEPTPYRIISVEEVEKHQYKVTGVYYDENKFDRVESGIYLPEAPYTNIPTDALTAPTNIDVQPYVYTEGGSENQYYGVMVSWTPSTDARTTHYEVQSKESTYDWSYEGTTTVNSYVIKNIEPVSWSYRVRGIAYNRRSDWLTYSDYEIPTISGITPPEWIQVKDGGTTWSGTSCEVEWATCSGANYYGNNIEGILKNYKVNVYRNSDDELLRSINTEDTNYSYIYDSNRTDNYRIDLSDPQRALKFKVWSRDIYDNLSSSEVTGTFTNPAPSMAGLTPTVEAVFKGVKIDWSNITPADNDGLKHIVYCDTMSPPASGVAETGWETRRWSELGLDTDTNYYAQIEPYDCFGVGTKSAVSSSFEPLKVSEIDIDGELSASITMTDSLGTTTSGLAVLYDRTTDSNGIAYTNGDWVNYDYGIENYYECAKIYTSASGVNIFISYKKNDGDWNYLGGEADHTLDSGGAMVSYSTASGTASTNYLTLGDGKNVPKFPNGLVGIEFRLHLLNAATIYELIFDREIIAEQIVADNLSAISANVGTVTAGMIQSTSGKVYFDLDNEVLVVKDAAGTTRVELGKVS